MATVTVSASGVGVDVAAELVATVEALRSMPAAVIDAAGPAAATAILDHTSGVRGTLSVSGLGATLDVLVADRVAGDTSASVRLAATPAGAWGLVDGGARAHSLRRRRGMPAPPYGVFSAINHPGTAGLGVWDGASAAVDSATDTAVDNALTGLPRD